MSRWTIAVLGGLTMIALSGVASAQVLPDDSLGSERSRVRRHDAVVLIEGGARRANALFHSFEQFDVGRGQSIYFDGQGLRYIFSRVTGQQRSRINGVLGVRGDADLFLMNPNGITFGPNARLDLQGTFVGSTASSLEFSDDSVFSARDPEPVSPLLTVRGHIGLRYGESAAPIRILSSGHQLQTVDDVSFNPFDNAGQQQGLSVEPRQAIVLLGGDVLLGGGVLSAPSGRIELGAVQSGIVRLHQGEAHYADDVVRGDVRLTASSLLDVSGDGGGAISVVGDRVSLADGSYLLSQNSGIADATGRLSVDARHLLIHGSRSRQSDRPEPLHAVSGLSAQTFIARGTDIHVEAEQVDISHGGFLSSNTYGVGSSGDIGLQFEALNVEGEALTMDDRPSHVQTATLGNGRSGDITLSGGNMRVADGGIINTNAFALLPSLSGQGGDIQIVADHVEVAHRTTDTPLTSSILVSAARQGRSGDLALASHSLSLLDGGFLGSFVSGVGQVGDVRVSSERIVIDGVISGSEPLSLRELNVVFSGVKDFEVGDRVQRSSIGSFFLPDLDTSEQDAVQPGISGDIFIESDQLTLQNSGVISSVNLSSGEAGNIAIQVNQLTLSEGGISANLVSSGDGGNVAVTARELYVLNDSVISGAVIGRSNGGNVDVAASTLVSLDSIFSANSQRGRGGNIHVEASALIGQRNVFSATSSLSAQLDGDISIEVDELAPVPLVIEDPMVDDEAIVFRQVCTEGSPLLGGWLALYRRNQRTLPNGFVFSSIPVWSPNDSEVPGEASALTHTASGWHRNEDGILTILATDVDPNYASC